MTVTLDEINSFFGTDSFQLFPVHTKGTRERYRTIQVRILLQTQPWVVNSLRVDKMLSNNLVRFFEDLIHGPSLHQWICMEKIPSAHRTKFLKSLWVLNILATYWQGALLERCMSHDYRKSWIRSCCM